MASKAVNCSSNAAISSMESTEDDWGSIKWGGLAQWLASWTTDQGVPGSRPGRGTVCCSLEQVTFTNCLVLVKPRKSWTDD